MTVVIPTYNRAVLLQKAIISVLSQTYSHLELIIADDGSTDNTIEMVHAMNDSRIKYLPLSHTGHIGKVRNAGATEGTGEWLAFLDSDDKWLPGKLQEQIGLIREKRKRWCYCGYVHVDEQGNTIPPKAGTYRARSGNITAALLRHKATVVVCTLLVERKLFGEAGGFSNDERLKLRGDYELALRLSIKAEVAASPEILVRVLEHPGRITSSITDAYERSAMPYRIFLEYARETRLRRIASQQIAKLLSMAIQHTANGRLPGLVQQTGKSSARDGFRPWLSAAYRAIKGIFNRIPYSPASKKL